MIPFNFILVATDFSVPADNAVRRAALLCKQHDARLRIVHVVIESRRLPFREWLSPAADLDLRVADARDKLQRLAIDLANRYDVTAEVEVRSGKLLEELQRAAAGADLLVMGQRRRSALSEMVLGSTVQRLLASSRKPVLVVKQVADAAYRRALVPFDFTPASDAAVSVAAALAPDIDLRIFHAFDSTGVTVMREADVSESVIRACLLREEAALLARMRRSMTRIGLDSRGLSLALGRGSPVKATLQQAQSMNADVLVATKQQRGRIATSVLGNINSLLVRSSCDMLIVSGWVRDAQQAQVVPALRPASRLVGGSGLRAGHASAAPSSSWMHAQLPAAAFMAGQQGRPRRAGK